LGLKLKELVIVPTLATSPSRWNSANFGKNLTT